MHLNFGQLEARNMTVHNLGTAPAAPIKGQMYFDTVSNTLMWYDGTTWQSAKGGVGTPPDATAGVKGVVQLAGDLSGTAAAPTVAALAITDAKVAAANKDGASGTPSMRTLGLTAAKAMPGNTTIDQINVPVTPLWMNGQKIQSLADPATAQEAATKNYVDTVAQGLDAKASVRAATTANITNLAGGAPSTLDGVTLAANDRVLVKDQTTQSANGLYTVTTLGTGANGTWTRATDADAWTELPGAYTFVEQGTAQADSGWVCTADQGGTLGTTAITWTQFSGAGSITAGNALSKTGNRLDVLPDNSSLDIAANNLEVKLGGISSGHLGSGCVDLGTSTVTGQLPVNRGGTGQATAKTARETGLGAAGYYSNSATHGAGTTITITQATHGLRASRAIHVQVQDNTTGNVELPDISVAANGDVTVTYAASVAANSRLVTLVG
jgi:hypothetical protein